MQNTVAFQCKESILRKALIAFNNFSDTIGDMVI